MLKLEGNLVDEIAEGGRAMRFILILSALLLIQTSHAEAIAVNKRDEPALLLLGGIIAIILLAFFAYDWWKNRKYYTKKKKEQ
jgi:hypothetical protein